MKFRLFFVVILIFLASLVVVQAFTLSERNQLRECNDQCKVVQKEGLLSCSDDYINCRGNCALNNSCKRNCAKEKNTCLRNTNNNYRDCQKQCRDSMIPGCLNKTYKKGDKFTQGCDICECNGRDKTSCKREAFCNKNVTVGEAECNQGGGFYQAFCNGPYFDIVCSQQKFCLCSGLGNYTCPTDYSCLTEFVSPNKRIHTINGWKTLLGRDLGQIGVCAK